MYRLKKLDDEVLNPKPTPVPVPVMAHIHNPQAEYAKASPYKYHRLVVSAAVVRNDRLLIIKRAEQDKSWPGYWEAPGGSVDLTDKTIADAVARELQEETGLTMNRIVDEIQPAITFDSGWTKPKRWLKLSFLVEVTETTKGEAEEKVKAQESEGVFIPQRSENAVQPQESETVVEAQEIEEVATAQESHKTAKTAKKAKTQEKEEVVKARESEIAADTAVRSQDSEEDVNTQEGEGTVNTQEGEKAINVQGTGEGKDVSMTEIVIPFIKLDPKEHSRHLWVTEAQVLAAEYQDEELQFISDQQTDVMLTAFRMSREKGQGSSQETA